MASVGHPHAQRRYGAWLLAAALIAAIGVAASAFAADRVSDSDKHNALVASQQSAKQLAAVVQLGLHHEEDLNLAAGAFVADHSNRTEANFMTWAKAIQVTRHYPEVEAITWIDFVPQSQLAQFESQEKAGRFARLNRGAFTIVPAGVRPYYCLVGLRLISYPATPNADYCREYPLIAVRDSGRTLDSVVRLPDGQAILAVVTPIYRGGSVPATRAARERDFLGWTTVSLQPGLLLAGALRGHRNTALILLRNASGATLTFSAGTIPRDARTITVNLQDSSSLEVLSMPASGGILVDRSARDLLVGGIILSLLLAALVLVLGTGRTRAMRLVAERTRELAAAAQESAAARDDAVEASNAKSVFVATVSHELRTPLSGVIGAAELMMERDLDWELRQYAEIIRSSSEGLLVVINDILDYSKIEAGKLELDPTGFALSELVAECCAMLLPSARQKGVALVVEAHPQLPAWLRGDAGRLRQVLINLLSNAVKFTAAGRVAVGVSATATAADVYLVHIEVADTGIGISDEALARLFKPFTQADSTTARRYGGTGLGLTISAQLIELMGGTIGARSTPGEGSTFWFEVELPLATDGEPASQGPARFRALGERDSDNVLTDAAPLVLVAEDNPVNQMLARRLLDKCGYRAEIVGNGREAVDATERTTYAAVVMDCQMPEMDGYEATRAIRLREGASATHLPIIATTAHSMSGDREKCLEAGMDDYLSKPIRARELRDLLSRWVVQPQSSATPAGV